MKMTIKGENGNTLLEIRAMNIRRGKATREGVKEKR